MVGRRRSTSTFGLNNVLTDKSRGSGPKFTRKKDGSGPYTPRRNRSVGAVAVCRLRERFIGLHGTVSGPWTKAENLLPDSRA